MGYRQIIEFDSGKTRQDLAGFFFVYSLLEYFNQPLLDPIDTFSRRSHVRIAGRPLKTSHNMAAENGPETPPPSRAVGGCLAESGFKRGRKNGKAGKPC